MLTLPSSCLSIYRLYVCNKTNHLDTEAVYQIRITTTQPEYFTKSGVFKQIDIPNRY